MSIFKLKKSVTVKAASVFVGTAMALSLVFGGAVAPAQAQTVEELTAQISSLLAMISSLQAQLSTMGGAPVGAISYNFTTNLSQGDSGVDVLNLQRVLNMDSATQVAASGVGSTGLESEYFGSLTKAAVIKFQNKYAAEVLTPVGLTAGTGYVGPSTRAKLNTMTGTVTPPTNPTYPAGCTSTVGYSSTTGLPCNGSGTVTPPVATGTGLTVTPASQPAATLAPGAAARVPFTKVVLTASADGAVTVNSILVERTGLAQDAAFAGIVLLDENGNQIGIAKTLNSLHQATVGDDFTIPAGTSKTVTIAGNITDKTSLASYTGQVASLSVLGVNTSAVVNGSFPIVGASHTMNSTLTIGTADAYRGIDDPNASATKEVGTTGYTFAAIKVTAGSAEKIRLHSIRWNQSGSVATSDLENLKTYVDGVAYDMVVSSDGKYYTANFGSGIVVDKGLSKEISVKGDIAGGSGRTIIFDIYKDTDLNVTGETYGYGITPTEQGTAAADADTSQFVSSNGTPWYDNATVTVSGGSLTVSKATSVEAQNISENVPSQPLGGFDVEVKGEAISVASLVFTGTISSGTGVGTDIDSVTLVDANGSVVAGPVDATGGSTTATVTFTDTVTFPIGKNVYTLQGQLATNFVNDQTITFATDPDNNWTTVTGQVTGNSITPAPTTSVSSNTMTLKAGTVSISVSTSPVAQTVVAGAQGFTFANYQFDATASGEDVRFTSLILALTASANSNYLTGCQLFDGTTALNTGSNTKDVASGITSATDMTFTLDSGGVTIPKGTVKTLALKCNLSSSATTQTYLWDMTDATDQTGTGLLSGTTITVADTTGAGQTMTATTGGTLTVEKQSGAYAIAAAGSTNVTLGQLKFTGTNEGITLKKLGLGLTSASSSPGDLVRVTLWDGETQVGTATFTSTDYATSTLTGTFNIPKGQTKVMTIKGDLARIGTDLIGTQGALLKVNYVGASNFKTSTTGTGDQSGGTVTSTTATDTAMDGIRVFRAYPEFAQILSTDSLKNNAILYKFSITAKDSGSSNGIGIYKFTLNLSTSSDNAVSGSTTVTNLKMFAYTDSGFSTVVSSAADGTAYTSGQIVDTIAQPLGTTTGVDNELVLNYPLQIPFGQTYYFTVVGNATVVSGTGTSANNWVDAEIVGSDTAYPSNSARLVDIATTIDGDTYDNFIWSPYATTTSGATTHYDWTNGYKVSGLDGMVSDRTNQ